MHRSSTRFILAAAPIVCSFPAQAQDPASLKQCHILPDSAERLACYDRVSGHVDQLPDIGPLEGTTAAAGQTADEQAVAAAVSQEELPSILDAAWRLTEDSDRYPISMYHANYILPLRYTNDGL